ncbi:uncharacterized protein LOC110188062 [Drosophila serrata]|uniref:uncharacterized protein LOC110188062 n=1 Tax=Drosophila serrata TaxID=7274 RepID=UPI000A1D1D78|nr:uncharacterized protein LOC110188062 [Drosophila serrata]
MAFRYIFVISALVVVAQGSYLSSVDQESEVGVHSSGGVSSGAAVGGISRGHPAGPQSQRPASGLGGSYGPPGGSQRPRPHGGSPRRQSGGYNRPSGGANRPAGGAQAGRQTGGGAAHGNRHQNRIPNQKPY